MIKTCTVASAGMVDTVLRRPLCEGVGVEINRMVNSSKAKRSGIASKSSRNDRIQVWDDCE